MDGIGNGNGRGRRDLIDWERLARGQCNELRVSILEVMALDGGRTLSPTDLSHELQMSIGNVNYHIRELEKFGMLEVVAEEPVRGATEHFYALVK
jgi:predicted ArsR family transcriptional regulator